MFIIHRIQFAQGDKLTTEAKSKVQLPGLSRHLDIVNRETGQTASLDWCKTLDGVYGLFIDPLAEAWVEQAAKAIGWHLDRGHQLKSVYHVNPFD